MSTQLYTNFAEAMLSGTDSWKAHILQDVVLIGPLGEFNGYDQFVEINTPFFASIQEHKVLQVIENGNWVLTRIQVQVQSQNSGIVTLDVSEWYEFEDGKIKFLRTYFDPSPML